MQEQKLPLYAEIDRLRAENASLKERLADDEACIVSQREKISEMRAIFKACQSNANPILQAENCGLLKELETALNEVKRLKELLSLASEV